MILTCINTSYINTAGHFQPLLSFTIFTCPSISFQPFFSCIFIYTFLSPYSIFLRIRHKSQIISAIIVMCVCVCILLIYKEQVEYPGTGSERGGNRKQMDGHFAKPYETSQKKQGAVFKQNSNYFLYELEVCICTHVHPDSKDFFSKRFFFFLSLETWTDRFTDKIT